METGTLTPADVQDWDIDPENGWLIPPMLPDKRVNPASLDLYLRADYRK